MAKPLHPAVRTRGRELGFSLVEMLVALAFTMVLMAGMATVFKGSLSTAVTAGEKLSSFRRNAMSLDMMYEDLNTAGMYLGMTAPSASNANELFYIKPDPGTPISGVTQGADELFFCMDEALPFEGTLLDYTGTAITQAVNDNTAFVAGTYVVDCGDVSYAKQVEAGQSFMVKDVGARLYIKSVAIDGSQVIITPGPDPTTDGTMDATDDLVQRYPPITSSKVVFYKRYRMVRYSLRALNLNPADASANTMSLVREVGNYSPAGFTADTTPGAQVITDNVSGFRVFLSADSGSTWAGGPTCATWQDVKAALNTQLAHNGRSGQTKIADNDFTWFRNIPLLVRVQITTRTAKQRSEYSSTGTTLAYNEQVRDMVLVPRHFGLPINDR